MILELERKTGVGIAALYARFMRQEFHFADMTEIIRTGLIGGGTSLDRSTDACRYLRQAAPDHGSVSARVRHS
ncbi:MAG: gene transfer agent family protein [Rhizobium sp.]|nr:gene transfer agent family protein [Rhizobium sp.]